MKLNDAKCHLKLFGNKSPGISVNIISSCIEQSGKEKFLGITFDKNLDVNCHVEDICKQLAKNFMRMLELQNSLTKNSYRQ